jgi:hypothetical protein
MCLEDTVPIPRRCQGCGRWFGQSPRQAARVVARFCSLPCFNRARAKPAAERLASGLSQPTERGCREWMGKRDSKGYGQIPMGHSRYERAHRVAYALTYGPITPANKVLHRCDNPPCCEPSHLFGGTTADNAADMAVKGRSVHGERHPGARLTENAVRQIRAAYAAGMSQRRLAAHYKVNDATIWFVVNKKTWRRVT